MKAIRLTELLVVFAICILNVLGATAAALDFPGPEPGKACDGIDGRRLWLENSVLKVCWEVSDHGLYPVELADKMLGATHTLAGEALVITLADGRAIKASGLAVDGSVRSERLAARPDAVAVGERCGAQRISIPLVDPASGLRVLWQAVLRDGANYVRQFVTLRTTDKPLTIESIQLVDVPHAKATVSGLVAGSPVVAGNLFFGCEHPNAKSEVIDGASGTDAAAGKRIRCRLQWDAPLPVGEAMIQSSVLGVAPAGQMRRAYLYYVERERPRPYKPFLHYNSWYDIAWADRKMDEAQCLKVIEAFGRELTEKRGVALDSFVFDDGWDDNKTLWGFHGGFPNGFTPLTVAAKKYDSWVGVWLSPWGGYGQAKAERVKYGQTQGFETNGNGFSLAGPKYYDRFRDACAGMIQKYDVNYFKFDGVGIGNDRDGADAQFMPDIQGLLRLCGDLRRLRPDVYLSITTGTWPSPYWLFYGDSIWRNGLDCGFHGAGSKRQQWITYRDMITYRMIVRRAPLYPLNSLMNQGICYAQLGTATQMKNDLKDVVDEIRMLFAGGTQLQELYVTPQMMTPPMWDALAEAASWSRNNADVLVDVHWLGGDPGEAEPYGYASWSPRMGILALRNPGKTPARLAVDLQQAFQLPEGSAQKYALRSPWKDGQPAEKLTLQAGRAHTFELAPFEALILEAVPVR